MKPIRNIEHLSNARVSASGEGMTYEVCEGTEKGKLKDGGLYPIFTVIEDEENRKWIELYPGEEIVTIPLDQFEDALKKGKEEAHNEAFYD